MILDWSDIIVPYGEYAKFGDNIQYPLA